MADDPAEPAHRTGNPLDGYGDQVGDGILVTRDFVACYQVHYRAVTRALRLAGADSVTAEDLAQEAFARALPHWSRVRRGSNPAGYVYRSAFRLLQRSERRRSRPERLPGPLPTASTEQDATTTVSVQVALARMPPRRRQCAVLCLVLGFATADAAAILGIAAGTVRKHLDEARGDLRAGCDPT
ncbi:MAG: sigma-70 family RNA polymerase sigma factor [Actinomycetota bacterium]|nr:sigma-70 family RNA polymerase sigma factor [Actinomycetota bacterium]